MTSETPALGICLEEYEYPHPVQFFPLSNDLQPLKMAYMDVPPGKEPNGKLHDAARLGDFVGLSAAAARDIPRARRVVIPECGHIPHLEVPDQFLAEFLPFLAS